MTQPEEETNSAAATGGCARHDAAAMGTRSVDGGDGAVQVGGGKQGQGQGQGDGEAGGEERGNEERGISGNI